MSAADKAPSRRAPTRATRRRPTLHDVANLAGVHVATASRALSDETVSMVSPETAARIRDAAAELGYQVNHVARGLKTKRSMTIGVIVPDLMNPIMPPIVDGIESRLDKAGYTVLLATAEHGSQRAGMLVEAMSARQVDGLILAVALPRDSPAKRVVSLVPTVLVNRGTGRPPLPSATPDERRCAELGVDHLVRLGHSRIVHVAGPANTPSGRLRLAGFHAAFACHGLAVGDDRIAFARDYSIVEGRRACAELLDSGVAFTAVAAANDLLALGCVDTLDDRGLTCPDDVSVIGINDMPFADRFTPPLTTVRLAHAQMGVVAAELLLERIADPTVTVRHVTLEPQLVVRASTAPPRSADGETIA
jgi:LacI family transcriptional regulator